MHEHLSSIHGGNPEAFGRRYEWRRAGAIDEIDYGTRAGQALEVEWELVVAAEPEAGRIHNQIEVACIHIRPTLGHAYPIPADPTRHRSGPLNRPIEKQYVLDPSIYKAEQGRAGRASRPEHEHPVARWATAEKVPQCSPEALDVRVVPTELSILAPKRVTRPRPTDGLGRFVEDRSSFFLMGKGDVSSAAGPTEVRHEPDHPFGIAVQRNVSPIDPGLLKSCVLNHGRKRVLNRITQNNEHPRLGRQGAQGAASFFGLRNSASTRPSAASTKPSSDSKHSR